MKREFSDYFLSEKNYSFSTAHMNYSSKVSKAYCEGLKGHRSIPSNKLQSFLHHYIQISVVNSAFIQRLIQNAGNQVTWHNILQDFNLCFCKLQND